MESCKENSMYLSVFSNLPQLRSLPSKTWPTMVEYVITPLGLWTTSGSLSRVCSLQDLPGQSVLGNCWSMANFCSWDINIRRRRGTTFTVLRISQFVPTSSQFVTLLTLHKKSISIAHGRQHSFIYCTRYMTELKTDRFAVFASSRVLKTER